ncbi:TonB-dependent siderophore receptor [Paraburkholderia sabiae]|uniref:TonB-dependent receptor n=1 Tax=Paraburkholderia sabiae TaxID=273251 RepID=A0ABU9QMD6_9BURK|nr:TonB-dependent receptor [Paraburkholderia sabiae]WJZ77338.1 TonB-dependent receptor [Paraburkholderia sabiae]CAD6547772.1 Ferric-anguibactin receptor FatA [Paraburkholderia sabiae]
MTELRPPKRRNLPRARRPAPRRLPAFALLPLRAALLFSGGVALSLSAPGAWAQSDADTSRPTTDSALPPVSVKARRDPATDAVVISAGALGARKQVDTPFSTNVKTSEDAKDLMAQSANDLFRYDPSVAVVGENATAENSAFSVRGMQIDMLNGVKVDGQSFPSWDTDLPLEPFEQVQLLKGLSGFMYGFGAPGGIVNYVLKRPTDTPYRSVSLGYQSAGVFSEKLDVGGRFGKDDRFGYRFNLVNENGNTAEANGHLRRQVASVALDFHVTPDLTWSLDAFYAKRKTNGTLFGMWFGEGVNIPDASSITHDLTQPQNWYKTEMASVGTGLDYRFTPNWHGSLKYRFAKENRYNHDSRLNIINNAGDYTNTLFAALTRYFYSNVDAMVEGKFHTGSIGHNVVVGAGYQTQVSEYDNSTGWNDGFNLGSGNLYRSTLLTNDEVNIAQNLYRQSLITQSAIYASDTVQLTSRLSALLGLRYTQFRQTVYNTDTTVSAGYSAHPVTPTIAVMFKTDPYSTLYASYVESLQAGGSASNTNVNFPQSYGPLKSKQYEVGYKTDHRTWGGSLALFRVDQGYEYTNTQNAFVQSGTKRYTGVDASGWLQVADDWRVLGGVMMLNAKGVDIDDALVDGKRVFATPRLVATGRVEYNPKYLRQLTLAFGGKYTGNMAVDAANTKFIPAYTTFDLSGKYETRIAGKDVTFRAGINNLFNRQYWTTAYGVYALPGATRTAVASATLQF